jgi:hypothetical protein
MLQIGFILLTLSLSVSLYLGAANVALKALPDARAQRRFIIKISFFLALWVLYISILSIMGVFAIATFPPRIPILLVAPAFAFIIYFFTSGRFNHIIEATPIEWTIYIQTFRISVEVLLWGLFLSDIFPEAATFEGYNFDILIGLTAPLVAYLGFKKGRLSPALIILWNCMGLLTLTIVVFILMSKVYFPMSLRVKNEFLVDGPGNFPYTFLVGFFMPLAVFMHIFSIVKTRKLLHL